MLPEELMLEILLRLPGKELGRCKCVCKYWQSIIRSPPFLQAYRSHQRALILYWPETVDSMEVKGCKSVRLSYYYSTLRRLKEPAVKFSYLSELKSSHQWDRNGRHSDRLTEMVNGLVCLSESDNQLTIHNVCTGQRMQLPDSSPASRSSFHFGYDPQSRTYKLLRLIYPISHDYRRMNSAVGAEILTLRSSSSLCRWRKLEPKECGILDVVASGAYVSFGQSALTVDGLLWWLSGLDFLFSFDLNKEKFQLVQFSKDVRDAILPHAIVFTQSMGFPAIWALPMADSPRCFILFVLENDNMGNNIWNKYCIQLPKELGEVKGSVVDIGNLSTGEILLMNVKVKDHDDGSRPVYSYNHRTSEFDRFQVGELPDRRLLFMCGSGRNLVRFGNFCAKICCLHENNDLYLPLEDVLNGGVLS